MAKPHQIKALSNLRGLSSLLMDLRSYLDKEPISKVVLDLSFVTAIDAVGAALLLGKLVELSKQQRYDQFELISPRSSEINTFLKETGATELFMKLLSRSAKGESTKNLDLFAELKGEAVSVRVPERTGREVYATLIDVDTCGGKTRQELVTHVRHQLRKMFSSIPGNQFNEAQIHVVVAEMIKNTVDHSGSRAFLGVDLQLDAGDKCKSIRLAYVDTGNGISQSVRSFLATQLALSTRPEADLVRKVKKGSASEFIRDAFVPDFTTKPNNGVNFGIGLTLIQRGIKGAGFSGLLLEAQSAINITSFDATDKLSHEEIRRGSSRILGNPPLTFVLEWNHRP